MLDLTIAADRPARRTALISQELSRYNVDIAALSETRLSDEGSLTEIQGGYTFYWKGLPQGERRIHGVGFAIRTPLVGLFADAPLGLNERLMRLRIPLAGGRYATLFSCYAPTLDATDDVKDSFYELLDAELQRVPIADKLIVLGDFNARVGVGHQEWSGVIREHGLGKMNVNGHRLLSLCAQNELLITNTMFQLKDIYKGTWRHPRSKHYHMLDYIIVKQRDHLDVQITRVMRGAECWTDHLLVRCKLALRIRPASRRQAPKKKLNCAALKNETIRQELASAVTIKLAETLPMQSNDSGIEDTWKHLSGTVTEVAEATLGYTKRKNQDWFDENIDEVRILLDRKYKANAAHVHNPTSVHLKEKWKEARSEAQRVLRAMENDWWLNKSSEIQKYADSGDLQNFHAALRRVYGPTNRALAPVRSLDGSILHTNKSEILDRWKEHYSQLLNTQNPSDSAQLEDVPDFPEITEMDLCPTFDEVQTAIKGLKENKSPGVDGIQCELIKHGGELLQQRLHHLICLIWETEQIPQQWKDAKIISLYKNKGECSVCGNSRGISLLSVAGKVLAKILLSRLNGNIVDEVCPESQCGFRRERGTIDMIFVTRQLQEKCREQNRDLCMAFIDLAKAFDTVNRDFLWRVMRKFGCPRKFTAIVEAFHSDMRATVAIGGEETESFGVGTGVKQGCVMAPVIFNIYLAAATYLFRKRFRSGGGVEIAYRLDGSLFNLRRLEARTKVSSEEICELQYADDCVLVAHSAADLQCALSCLYEVYSALGLVINTNKTEVLYQWNRPRNEDPRITVAGAELKTASQFTYLGSIVSSDCSQDAEVNNRIRNASASFARIRKRVILNHNLKTSTKVSVYRAVCLSVLLYGSETLTLYVRHVKLLESFHIQCLKKILGLNWQDRVPHTEILTRAGLPSVECLLLRGQLRWVGHVLRMPVVRYPRRVLYGQLSVGRRNRGSPKKRYKDHIKKTLKNFNIDPYHLESSASDRALWRSACHDGAEHFENERTRKRMEQRERRHQRLQQPVIQLDVGFQCPECGRTCGSRIGLHSHQRTHRTRQVGAGHHVIIGNDGHS